MWWNMSLCRASHQYFMFFHRFRDMKGFQTKLAGCIWMRCHMTSYHDSTCGECLLSLSLSLSSPSASLSNMRDHWNADSSNLVGTRHCVRRQTSQHLARTHTATVEERHLLSCLRTSPHKGMITNHFQFFQSTPPVTVRW